MFLVVRTGVRDRGVITDHIEFGRRVLEGRALYAPYLEDKPLHAPYPPGFGLMTAPFAVVPERVARFLWGLLQVVALGVVGWWLRDALGRVAPALRPRLHWLLLGTALLASRYVLRDTHGGGGNAINLALGLGAMACAERGRWRLAGLALGFSLATKPSLVLLAGLLWLLGYRRAAMASLGAAAGFTAVSLWSLGQGLEPLLTWMRGTLAYATQHPFDDPAYGFPPFTWMNQSLRCAVARYLGTVPAEHAAEIAGFFQGAGLAPAVTTWVTRAIAVVLLTATAVRVVLARDRDPARPWLVAATLCLSTLLSPITWKAHLVALVPAFFLILVRAVRGNRICLVFLVTYALACLPGEDITGKTFKNAQQSLYVFTAGSLVTWWLCLRGARHAPGAAYRST